MSTTETSEETVKVSAEVKTAAKILDKALPGWHQRVDIDRLEMGDCSMCMLGQTFGLNAEMGIAKELYPEEWAEAAASVGESTHQKMGDFSGYEVGLAFFRRRAKGKLSRSLDDACEGKNNGCEWISEIVDRRQADEKAGILPSKPAKKARGKK